MASPAHCFYCFEVLAASYEGLEYPDLETVLQLYEQWESLSKDEEAAKSVDESSLHNNQLQLPSLSRLKESSTPSSASQSSGSTPASTSVNSSNTQLSSATTDTSIATSSYASRLSVTKSYPLFVTWNTLRGSHKSLRGCIGTFEGLPLEDGLKQYAWTSAFEDTRFSPISEHQVPNLACSLTLLADFEETDGPLDWDLGTHGIRISFTHRSRRHGATYLPDVAVEQGWTKEETLESLMRKGGWEGSRRYRVTSTQPWEEVKDFRVVRYTGLKASATYSEWQEWQTWAKEHHPSLWDA